VAKLPLVLALSLLAVTGAASASSGIAIVPLRSVGGAEPTLAGGAAGKVAVVATGPEQSDKTIPIALRNNTSHDVNDVKIAATAYVKSRLVATGSDQGIEPNVIAPHGLAIAYVYFGIDGPPTGASFKFSVTSDVASVSGFDHIDLPIKTANYIGGKLVGIAHNSAKTKISGPLQVFGTCFSGTRIVAMESGFSDAEDAAAGADAPFTLDFTDFGTGSPPHCSRILVGMSGYSF
jgi:hypothetical protein